jgi:hypothetical protein
MQDKSEPNHHFQVFYEGHGQNQTVLGIADLATVETPFLALSLVSTIQVSNIIALSDGLFHTHSNHVWESIICQTADLVVKT